MSRNNKIIIILTFLFFLIFSVMVIAGIHLMYKSWNSTKASNTNVKLVVSERNFQIELTTAIPGIVLVVLGAAGLFLMVIKAPAREIVGYQSTQRGRGNGKVMYDLSFTLQKPIYSDKIYRIPLPVWWLIKGKRVFLKIEKTPDKVFK